MTKCEVRRQLKLIRAIAAGIVEYMDVVMSKDVSNEDRFEHLASAMDEIDRLPGLVEPIGREEELVDWDAETMEDLG